MKKLRHITIVFLSLLMVVVSVNAYQKNISLSLESIAPSIDAGEQATFIMDFKTTGSTQNLKEVTVEIDLPKDFEMITSLEELSLLGVVPKLEDSQLRYEFEELQTGITQKNVMAFKTINGEHLNGEVIPVSARVLVGDEVVESTDAKTTIRAVGNLTVAKVVKDVDGKGEFATPKKSSSITWQLRISSDKHEEAQLFIDPDSEIVLVDKLPKFVKYVSDSHGGTYDAKAHTVTWVFDAPSLEAQRDAEGYLFLETIDLETQVTGITSNKYFENITNSAEGQLTQIDKTVLKRTANATTTITGTESVIPPEDGNWIRGNFRGPSDGKNGIAPVADPQLDITLDESAKISFGSGYYIHHGTGTTVYVGNQKLVSPSNTERKKHGIGFEQIIEKGYQYVDMVYDVGDGLLLEAIRIRKPRLYAKKASDQDFLPSNLPIAIIELNTVDGKKFNHQVDFRAYTGNFKTFDVLDITGGENVEVRDFRIKFIPNETQSVLDGNFAATFVEMRYRVKPGTEGIIENKYHAEFKVNGNNKLIKYVGEKSESAISSRSVTIKKDPKGTPPITEVEATFNHDHTGVVLPGKNFVDLKVENVDGSLKNLTGNYVLYLSAPKSIHVDLDAVKATKGFEVVDSKIVETYDHNVFYKFEVEGPLFGLAPAEFFELTVPVDVDEMGPSRIHLDVYMGSKTSDMEVPTYPTDIPANTVYTPKDNVIYQAGVVKETEKLISSRNSYSMVKKQELITRKKVKGSLDEDFENFGHVELGGNIDYRLELLHTYGSPVTDMVIVDVLPSLNDLGITDNVARGSQFNLELTGPLVLNDPLNDCFDVYYSTEKLIKRTDLNQLGSNKLIDPEGAVDPNWKTADKIANWSDVKAFKLVIKSNRSWASDEPLTIDFSMKAPEKVDVDLISISKDDVFKKERAAWNSFAVAMVNMQIIEPSRVGVAIVDKIPVESPKVDKNIKMDDGLVKESVEALEKPFTYKISVDLLSSVNGYETLVIEDEIHEDLEILGVRLNGESVSPAAYQNQHLKLELDRVTLINWVKEGIDTLDVEIDVQLKEIQLDETFEPISIFNTAKVTINGDKTVEPEQPTKVIPKVEYGELTVVVTEGDHAILEREDVSQLGDVRLEGSVASVVSNDDHDFVITTNIETEIEPQIVRLPVGSYNIKQTKVIDGYLITDEVLTVTVKPNELTVVEILNPKEPTPAEFVSEKSVRGKVHDTYGTPGETLIYEIKIKNIGETEGLVKVQDTLSTIEDYVKIDSKQALEIEGHTLDQTYRIRDLQDGFVFDLPGETEIWIRFEVVLNDKFDAINFELVNEALVNEEEIEGRIPIKSPKIEITKSFEDENGDGKAHANEMLTYTLTVSNTGEAQAKGVIVKDDLTHVLPYVSDVSDVIMKHGNAESLISIDDLKQGVKINLDVNETKTFTFTVRVKDDLEDGQEILNVAYADDEEDEVVVVHHQPDVYIEKNVTDENGNGLAEMHERLTYTITVGNKGEVPAYDVLVKDTLSHIEDYVTNPSEVILTQKGMETSYTLEALQEGILVNLDADEIVTFEFSVYVKEGVEDGAEFLNVAYADDEEDDVTIPHHLPKVYVKKMVEDENGNHKAEAGETLTYTITVSNEGIVSAKAVEVRDDFKDMNDLVEDVSKVILTQGDKETTYTLKELEQGIKIDLDAQEVATFVFTVKVKDNLEDGQEILNTVYADEEEREVIIPHHKPDVYVEKHVEDENGDDKAEAGEKLTYTITVGNRGKVIAKDVLVSDDFSQIEDYVTDVSDVILTQNDEETAYSLENLQEGIAINLEADEAVTFVFTVKVKDDLDDGQKLLNTVYADEKEDDVEIVYHNPKVYVEKDVQDENNNNIAEAHETLTYTITVGNDGEVAAKDVVVKDDFSNIEGYVYDVSDVILTRGDDEVTYSLNDLQSGITLDLASKESVTLSFSVKVKDDLEDGQKLLNTVYADEEEDEVEIFYHDPEVYVNKDVKDENGNGKAEAHETLTYTITVGNRGKVMAKDVLVKDDFSNVKDYVTDVSDVTLTQNDVESTYTLEDLEAGIVINLESDEEVTFVFSVTVKDDLEDGQKLLNTVYADDEEDEVEIFYHDPEVYVNKQVKDENGNGKAEAHETLTYTITVGNRGKVMAKDVLVKDDFSNVKDYVTDVSDVTLTQNDVESTYTLEDLEEGVAIDLEVDEEVFFVFTVKVKDDLEDGQKLLNTVYADDEESRVEIPYHEPEVYVNKQVKDENDNGKAEPNETLTYTITVGNKGIVPAKNVLVKDDLVDLESFVYDISDVILVRSDETSTHSIENLQEGIRLDLDAKEEVTLSFTVKAKDDLEDGQKLLNTVYADDEEDEVEMPYHAPDLYVSKSVRDENQDGFAEAHETLTYTITVGNKGVVSATDVLIKDDLKDLENFVYDISDVVLTQNNHETVYAIENLKEGILVDVASDEEITFVFTVKVKDDLKDGQKLLNTVYADDEEDEVEITYHDPILSVSKNVFDENGNGKAEAHETLTYEIVVRNDGNVSAKGVMVRDDLNDLEAYVYDISRVSMRRVGFETTYDIDALREGITVDVGPHESIIFTFTVKVKDDLDDGQKLLNTVFANDEEDEVEITYHNPQLRVIKTSQDEIVAGEDLAYEITIENVGAVEIKEILVTDTLEDLLPYLVNPHEEVVYVNNEAVGTVQDLMEGMILNGLKPNQKHVLHFIVKTDKKLLKDIKILSNTVQVNDETSTVEVPVVYPEKPIELPTTGSLGVGIFAWSFIYAGLALLWKRRRDY